MIRVATDVGGTFTDIVWVDEATGEVRADKTQTTPRDIVAGVLDALHKTAVAPADVGLFIHGSTVATNALIVKRGSKTGLITTKGFRDALEIRRINRPDEHIYNIFWRKPEPLVPRRLRLEISARMRFDGAELVSVNRGEVEDAVATLRAEGVEAIAVCLLHAYADPRHELAVREIIHELWPDVYVSLSHEVAREIREYERVSSTVIDAYIKKPVVSYLRRLESALHGAGMQSDPLIANSTGGVSTVETIERAPIQMIASGPAGGAIGAATLAGQIGLPNLLNADVGGTSYDVSLVVDGQNVLRTEHEVLGYTAKLSSIDVRSVGAGGGSIAYVDEGGLLHVGPGSAGADPGPMCYGKGGDQPTVTDAAVVTGLIDPARFAGGEIKLDVDLAREGIGRIARRLGLDLSAAAEGMLTVARNNMGNISRQILVGQGYDPRDFALLSFGGGGGLFASEVARALDIPTVVVPVHPAAFSAWGMLSADIVGSFARSYVQPIDDSFNLANVERLYQDMQVEAVALMREANIPADRIVLQRSVDARYEGQGHEVEVPLDGVPLTDSFVPALAQRFDELHEIRYGHRMSSARQTVTFRLRAFGRIQKLPLTELPTDGSDATVALKDRRPVYLAGRTRDCGVYDRGRLCAGVVIEGPALIEEPAHVTVVLPGDRLRVDRFGNLVITVGA